MIDGWRHTCMMGRLFAGGGFRGGLMTGHWTAKPVLRALLGLALVVPSVLAPLPAAAQSLPTVSFSPTTVAPGGTIIVNVGGFTCLQPVTIDLISESDFNQVITLGSLLPCK